MLKQLLTVSLAVILTGCASTPIKTTPISYTSHSVPALNAPAKATLGERMLMQATGYYADSITVQALDAYAADIPQTTTFYRAGGLNMFSSDAANTVVVNNGYGTPLSFTNSIIYDVGADKFCIHAMLCYSSKEASFTYNAEKTLKIQPNSLQQVIEYNGKSGDVLKFTYREFNDSMARSAFTTDFTMDLSEGSEIGYKGAVIKVIEATNRHISYVVVSNFNG